MGRNKNRGKKGRLCAESGPADEPEVPVPVPEPPKLEEEEPQEALDTVAFVSEHIGHRVHVAASTPEVLVATEHAARDSDAVAATSANGNESQALMTAAAAADDAKTTEEPAPKEPALAAAVPKPAAAAAGVAKTKPPVRVHPRADPLNDSADVAIMRGKLQRMAGAHPDIAAMAQLAQQITRERYPLDATEQHRRSEARDREFKQQFGDNPDRHRWDADKKKSSPSPPPPAAEPSAAEPPAAGPGGKRGVDMTDEEALAARDRMVAQLREVLADIDRMKKTQAEWKADLERIVQQENDEDDRARELFKEVMTSEAFFLGDREFREWMAKREDAAAGVGSEGLSKWYECETLVSATPFDAFVPFPRNLSDAGRDVFVEAADEVMADARRAAGVSETAAFVVESHPVHPHHTGDLKPGAGGATQPPTKATVSPVTTGKELLAVIDSAPRLRLSLDQQPCVFLSLASTASAATRSPHATVVNVFIAGGEVVAVAPAEDGAGFRLPAGTTASPTVVRKAAATAVSKLHGRTTRQELSKRSLVALVLLVPSGADSDIVEFDAALLNVAAFEPREYPQFEWTDLLGLIAMRMNTARRMETRADAEARAAAPFDAAAAAANIQVRGDVVVSPAATAAASAASPDLEQEQQQADVAPAQPSAVTAPAKERVGDTAVEQAKADQAAVQTPEPAVAPTVPAERPAEIVDPAAKSSKSPPAVVDTAPASPAPVPHQPEAPLRREAAATDLVSTPEDGKKNGARDGQPATAKDAQGGDGTSVAAMVYLGAAAAAGIAALTLLRRR